MTQEKSESGVKRAQRYHSMCLMHLSDNCMTSDELMSVLVRLGNYNTSVTGWRRKLWGLAIWKVARIKGELKCSLTQFEEEVIGIRVKVGLCASKLPHDEWLKLLERIKAKRGIYGKSV